MSLAQLLNIGRSALSASQFGLEVAGNNIANVNTPGYSRQRVSFVPGVTVSVGGNPMGTGVDIGSVNRIYDAFLGYQIHKATASMNDYQLREQIYTRVESLIYPSEDSNLGTVMDEFFNAWHDLASNPAGPAEREVVLAKGEEVAANLRSVYQSLDDEMAYSNTLMEGYRDEINRLTSEVANLNAEILRNQAAHSQPNDLLDRRDTLLTELSTYIDITVYDQETGGVAVLASGGQPLVQGNDHYDVQLATDPDNHSFYQMMLRGTDITDSIQGGKVKALLEVRENMSDFQRNIDLLAATLVREVNLLHRGGYGLDGNTDRDFFTPMRATTLTPTTNQGGVGVSLQQVTDPAALTLDDYEIRFTGANTYDIVNTTHDTVVAAGQTYVSGNPIDFDGIRLELTDVTGPPMAGDVVRVSTTDDMARDIQRVIQDAGHVAAAEEQVALPGDNRNALAIAALRNQQTMPDGRSSFQGYFQTLVGDVGSVTQDAGRKGAAKEALYQSMESYRQSVSGVSLEEEEIRLVAFQHSYQAAAKYLSTVDDMVESLIQL